MIEPIATSASPAEAPASLARVEQLQALAAKVSEATSPSGQESFAAALQAATESSAAAEAGMQPEAIPGAEIEPMPSAEAEAIPSAEVEAMSGAATAVTTAALEQAPGAAAATTPASLTTAALPYSPQSGLAAGTPAAYASSASAYPVETGQAPGASYIAPISTTSLPASTTSLPAPESQRGVAGSPAPYEALIQQAAIRNGVEPALLKGLIEQESGFDPNAHSSAGALGLTQLMPSTAASLGVGEPLNPAQSIEGGAHLLGQLLRQFGGNVSYALAAYNAGAGAVQRYGGIPPYPETEAYVSKVLANARAYQRQAV